MNDSFTHREVPRLGHRLFRLGLALNYGVDAAGVELALERGVNYFFWTAHRTGKTTPPLLRALAQDRARYVVATGPTVGWTGFNIRRGVEAALRRLRTDYLDVVLLYWLGVMSAYSKGTLEALEKLKAEGKVRAIGCSIHDRPRAGRLAEDSPLDLFMLRYNAAHPGAEKDIFPHLAPRRPAVVAYTATAWRRLLKKPRGWEGEPLAAPDCYRFCLSNPHVDVVLTGPKSKAELLQNLDGLGRGPMTDAELANAREFGRAVHG